ncbi:MAG: four helix bundle protein [Acidobacteriota bacterium]
MGNTNFENLEIYQLSEKLADGIWNIVLTWNNLATDTLGKQVIRSADSIGANIAEGSGRRTPIDNRRFLRMARGSLYETRHWLRRARTRNLLTNEQIEVLAEIINELTPKLNSYIGKVSNTVKENQKRDN